MERNNRIKKVLIVVVGCMIMALYSIPVLAATQSHQVAVVSTLSVLNGGAFPSTVDGFTAFSFHTLVRQNITLAYLGAGGVCGTSACDTVLLNVASSGTGGLNCNVNGNLTAQQKADLVTFVHNGGKLIIWDSECSSQNYTWLPYSFTTNNPGAQGATGTCNIVEDNNLASKDTLSTYYINAANLASSTDAIGDMNVMTTRDPNWCLSISGTNVNHVTGPVQTYARYGSGLIIYNGMDTDYEATGTLPSTTGAGNLAKIWYQQLLVPFNPTPLSALPCGITVVGINLTPPSAINDLGLKQTTHTVTATLLDLLNHPQPNIQVAFTVTGVNGGVSGSGTSDANGHVTFTYTSNGLKGTDTIKACFTNQAGQEICSQNVTKDWIMKCDVDGDNNIDRNDINLIFAARGTTIPPGAGNLLDIDGDGMITVNDARACTLQCSKPNCAP